MMRCLFARMFLLIIGVFVHTCIIAQREYIVTVNPATGVITKIDSIPGVRWLFQGYKSIHSQFDGRYTFFGMYNQGAPYYLYTVNVDSGKVVFPAPEISTAPNFLYLEADRYSNNIYGVFHQNSIYSIRKINPETGIYTTICDVTNVSSVLRIIPSNIPNKWFVLTATTLGDRYVRTIDITTGQQLSEVPFPTVHHITYHSQTNQFYAIKTLYQSPAMNSIHRLCRIDANTGVVTELAQLPNVCCFSTADETLNENSGVYYFGGTEWNDITNYLYSVDITTGNILNRVSIPQSGGVTEDNLMHFRYDNNRQKLYALFWDGNISEVLPVKLGNFFATAQQNKVICNWETLQEFNASHFILERSENAADFLPIGKITATGNSSIPHHYQFVDDQAFAGGKTRLYYRLKIVDDDGKYEYSQVREVNNKGRVAIRIYPNPIKDVLQLHITSDQSKKLQLQILSVDGRLMVTEMINVSSGSAFSSVNIGRLATGNYLLRISATDEAPFVQRFIKH